MAAAPMADVELREYRPGDETAILATFNLVFREVCGDSYVDRTRERWRWEFADNPQGMRVMLAVTSDGLVAGQYAGVPMRVWSAQHGRELSFFHAVDSMVHPDYRKGLRKKSLFIEVAERYFETWGGVADELGFGYPVRPAWRVGERYLGYRLVRTLDFLRRPTGAVPSDSPVTVDVVEAFPREVDALFAEARQHCACTTVKDARYLDWRYAACPDVDYFLLWAHRWGRPAGSCVLRTEGGLVPATATIGDILIDPTDSETLPAIVQRCDELAVTAGCTHLMTVQNPQVAVGRAFAEIGFTPEPSATWLERKLGSRDFTSGLTQEWLAENWAYALGDSDLF